MALLKPSAARSRPRFHELQVTGVDRLTNDAVAIRLGVPDDLAASFLDFEPGQYLTIRATVGGELIQRSYSLCLSPQEAKHRGEVRIATARVPEGVMSTWLTTSVQQGDTLSVLPPLGSFTCPTQPEAKRLHVAIVAGSGITPVLSLIGAVLALEPHSQVVLLYGNRAPESVMFHQELVDLEQAHPGRLEVVHVFSQHDRESTETDDDPQRRGRLDPERIERLLLPHAPVAEVDEFYLAGPSGLVDGARSMIHGHGVDPAHVHEEVFY